jgi:hypothetical protein
VLTGAISIEDLNIRASQGSFMLVPPELNETALIAAGLVLQRQEDRTHAIADVAARLYAARQGRLSNLIEAEGLRWFSQRQTFLASTAELASTRRLSRFLYIAEKVGC